MTSIWKHYCWDSQWALLGILVLNETEFWKYTVCNVWIQAMYTEITQAQVGGLCCSSKYTDLNFAR